MPSRPTLLLANRHLLFATKYISLKRRQIPNFKKQNCLTDYRLVRGLVRLGRIRRMEEPLRRLAQCGASIKQANSRPDGVFWPQCPSAAVAGKDLSFCQGPVDGGASAWRGKERPVDCRRLRRGRLSRIWRSPVWNCRNNLSAIIIIFFSPIGKARRTRSLKSWRIARWPFRGHCSGTRGAVDTILPHMVESCTFAGPVAPAEAQTLRLLCSAFEKHRDAERTGQRRSGQWRGPGRFGQ